MSNNNILALVKQYTQQYIERNNKLSEEVNKLKEQLESLNLRHSELKSAYQDMEREHNMLLKEKETIVSDLTNYFNTPNIIEVQQCEEKETKNTLEKLLPTEEKVDNPLLPILFSFANVPTKTESPSHCVNNSHSSPRFSQRRHRLFNSRRNPYLRKYSRYSKIDEESEEEDMKSFSTPEIVPTKPKNENTEVLKRILTDDFNYSSLGKPASPVKENNKLLKEATFSFNNMKPVIPQQSKDSIRMGVTPYIFTLDKNNKKN